MSGVDLVGMMVFMGSLIGMAAIIARAVLRYQDRKLRGRGDVSEPAVHAALEEMRAELAEQRDVRQRVLELEERMDFAERMLAEAKRGRLNAGGEAGR